MKLNFKLICFLFVLLMNGVSFAQVKTISGIVSDSQGPLPGASVTVSGTQKGVITNFDGGFEISATVGDELTFSYLGYKSRVVVVGATKTINVTLQEDVVIANEVVVSGYQVKKKEDITGSYSVITREDLGDQKVTTIGEALVGVAGVQVVNNSGQPGSNPTIRLRGPASLSGNLDPLIILDGAEYRGNLNTINFDDLQSQTVLKDADAVAIYGNRGARGVIVLTTKKGKNKNGSGQFNFSTSFGISDKATKEYDYVNATQMMQLIWKGSRNSFINGGLDQATASNLASTTLTGQTGGYNPFNVAQPIDNNGNVVAGAELLYDTDWYDIVTQKAFRQDVNLSYGGNTDKTSYFLSGNFLDQDGVMLNSKFKRVSGRFNLETEAKKWLKVGFVGGFSDSFSNVPAQSGSTFANNLSFTRSVSNIYPVYTRSVVDGSLVLDNEGNPIYDWGDGVNGGGSRGFYSPYSPLFIAENNLNKFDRTSFDIAPFIEISFTDDLKFKTQYSYSFYLLSGNTYQDPRFGSGAAVNGRSTKNRFVTNTYTWFNTLSYNKTIAEKHKISLLAGQELYSNENNLVQAQGTGFPAPGYTELNLSSTPSAAKSVVYLNRLFSYFGRADYSFDRRYAISGTFRRDASSRFIGDNRWVNSWSAGGSWTLTNENFLEGINNLDLIKIRGSYGLVPNEDILTASRLGDIDDNVSEFLFPYFGAYGSFPLQSESGLTTTRNPNPELGWEVHKKMNLGLDFGFFKNRINGSFEYFNTKITDLIYRRNLPPSENGELPTWVNSASMTNKGWELEINSVNVSNDNFSWNSSFSISSVKNNIDYIEDEDGLLRGNFNWKNGYDRYEFYMQKWAGVDTATGAPLWYTDEVDATTGDPLVTTSDYAKATRYYSGKSALPDFDGRFANMFKYKNFDLNIVMSYRFGNYIYNSDYAGLMHGFHGANPGSQLHPDIYDAWEQPGDVTDVPLLSLDNDQSNSTSTRWLQKGDFLRLRTMSLGYSLDRKILDKANIASMRLYVTADNYFTWKKEDRIDDPEQSYEGSTNNGSTILKTLTFGINVKL
ncbi:SusC/RagA family TonB-linked outer membrane protein [Flavobacterium sp.]|uniref:SusC/RagA family TonB-linked outer membrane protein n=1 Tax=Flavobacterium sp. TaxID=239 RepID=UPI0040475FDF